MLTTILLVFSGQAVPSAAVPVITEIEPNDTPDQALDFEAPVTLSGSLGSADQDAFRWRISEADALRRWTLSLHGVPGALTGLSVIRVEHGPDSGAPGAQRPVIDTETLVTFGTRDGSRPVTHRDLFLPAGDYVVGLFGAGYDGGFRPPGAKASTNAADDLATALTGADAPSGAGPSVAAGSAYRVHIEPGSAVSFMTAPPSAERAGAAELSPRTEQAVIATGTSWHAFELDREQAESTWSVRGEVVIGRALDVSLHDGEAQILATTASDGFGRFELPNLVLEPGRYAVKLAGAPELAPSQRAIRLVATGRVGDTTEAEPNDTWPMATRISLDEPVTGRVDSAGEADHYRFDRTGELADHAFDLVLESPDIERIALCLLDTDGVRRQCRDQPPPVTLDSLVLGPGAHGLVVERAAAVGTYTLSARATRVAAPDREAEPNDRIEDASTFPPRGIIKGTLAAADTDYFTLFVDGAAQLWRLQAIGSDLRDLDYLPQHGEAGASVRAGAGARRLRLDNLFLLPGKHQFALTANAATSYVLRALPLGPPSPQAEREPNQPVSHAQPLPLGETRIGLLTETTDTDFYRFHVAQRQALEVSLESPPDGVLRMQLHWDSGLIKDYRLRQPGAGVTEVLWLEPGDYQLRVSAPQPSDAEYRLQVAPRPRPSLLADREPNDNAATANAVPASFVLDGRVGVSHGDYEWYRLPTQTRGRNGSLSVTGEVTVRLVDDAGTTAAALSETEDDRLSFALPEDEPTFAYLSGSGQYRVVFEFEGLNAGPRRHAADIDVAIAEPKETVAAYQPLSQRLSLEATVTNATAAARSVSLETRTSDAGWQLRSERDWVRLEPGATRSLTLELTVAPDAWPDPPVQLQLLATTEEAGVAHGTLSLSAERNVPPIGPALASTLPEALRGSINVAAARFGAEVTTLEGSGVESLNDGMAVLGWYFSTTKQSYAGPGEVAPVIDLAGDEPVQILGFSVHPFGLQGTAPGQRNVTSVALALSTDGSNFETVMKTRVSARQQQQAFVLPRPTAARFARLTLLGSRDAQLIALGEWKVLAAPDSLAGLARQNIASPELGGHVVWTAPAWPSHGAETGMLTSTSDAPYQRAWDGTRFEWVIGFHHNRAARIEALSWRDGEEVGDARFHSVDVFASEGGPLGPWRKLATWELDGRSSQRLELEEPRWARFLRFAAATPITGGGTVYFPDELAVYEAREASAGSVLGEWGHDTHLGPFEADRPPKVPRADVLVDEGPNAANPVRLEPGIAQDGRVSLAEYDRWYSLTVPPQQNHLTVTLSGFPTVAADAELLDADRQPVAWVKSEQDRDRLVHEAPVAPGEYLLRVFEPPRSVVFTWDTSGSTRKVRPVIRQAVLDYVQGVRPTLDEAHMLPFGGSFLSQRWLDQPYLLQTVLNDYNGAGDSSAAESALVEAAEKLRDRVGRRIIVIVTDAATTHDGRLWPVLNEVRPTIIALGVSSQGAFSSNPPAEQDRLQDWAMVGGGSYEYVESAGALARAYDRAASRIRQPAAYRIEARTAAREPPARGTLLVAAVDAGGTAEVSVAHPAIEIVLDASGSMLQRLGDERRYQVARRVLQAFVEERLPEGIDFALRAFGHRQVGSCRTDLEVPMGPLHKPEVLSRIERITPMNLAKTPIAASLAAAAGDLSATPGEKVILLITDGEETCEGDPEAAIEQIRNGGVTASVNIVGFALDDEAVYAQFERWAELGGGAYRSASDAAELAEHVERLTALQFFLQHPNGERSGPYTVAGEPIELDAGRYVVDFRSGQEVEIEVTSGQQRVLRIGRGTHIE